MIIETFLLQRYPGDGPRQIWRSEIAKVCRVFAESGVADAKFTKELCSGSEQKFWACISEAFLAARLREMGLDPAPSKGGGPDFVLTDDNGRKIWIEVICPEPTGIPADWLTSTTGVIDFPHEQILLRWTSAIKEKAEKLIGSEDGAVKGYREKGIVGPKDAYVIAVNGRQLRGPFVTLLGISQFPFAVEAVFAIGPRQVKINLDSLKLIDAGYQHRPLIQKPNGAQVPAYTFLDPRFQPISAIWAVDLDGTAVIGNPESLAVIHNPNAVNPAPNDFLPAQYEYVAASIGMEFFELNRIEGCLRPETDSKETDIR